MPNAKCDNCNQYIQDICVSDKQKLLLIQLIKLRAKKKIWNLLQYTSRHYS